MLKKIALLALFCLGSNLYAQDEKIDTAKFTDDQFYSNFQDDIEIATPSDPYAAFGGGYSATFLFLNYDDINDKFGQSHYGMDELSGPILINSGEGFFPLIGVLENGVIGIYGMGGSKSVSKDFEQGGKNFTKKIDLTVSGTGLSIGYGIKAAKSFVIVPNIRMAYGSMRLDYSVTPSEVSWNDTAITGAEFHSYNNTYYSFQPNISFEYSPAMFVMLRANAGYNLSIMGDWKYNETKLSNAPKIKMDGLSLQIGIFFGIFSEK